MNLKPKEASDKSSALIEFLLEHNRVVFERSKEFLRLLASANISFITVDSVKTV